jgi:hypothetical protein
MTVIIIGLCLLIIWVSPKNNKFAGNRIGNMYLGDTVLIFGLTRGCYNNKLATIISHDLITGRYVVRLKSDLTYISIKPYNIRRVSA